MSVAESGASAANSTSSTIFIGADTRWPAARRAATTSSIALKSRRCRSGAWVKGSPSGTIRQGSDGAAGLVAVLARRPGEGSQPRVDRREVAVRHDLLREEAVLVHAVYFNETATT